MNTEYMDIAPAPGTNIQTGLLMAVLEDVTNEWRDELGEVSDEAILWQPFPGGHSIGALILHMADVEAYWLHQIGAAQDRSQEELSRLLSEETQQDQISWPTPPAHPLSWYYTQQDAIRARTRELVMLMGEPEAQRTRQKGDQTQVFTHRWLLNHVISHEAYHGGQAALLSVMHSRH